MSIDDLRDAAKALRDSIAALTEGERASRWEAGGVHGDDTTWWVGGGGMSIANCGMGGTAQAAAQHIARTASPHVAALVAEHLEVLAMAAEAEAPLNDPADVVHGWAAAHAMAVAILGGEEQ